MTSDSELFDAARPLQLADQGAFYITGDYHDDADGRRRMSGQMFVQYQIPAEVRAPYPIVLIHGGGQTTANFISTPDGRRGWIDYFLAHGYPVYSIDQPSLGRSGYYSRYGDARLPTVETTIERFTAPAVAGLWPQAARHTQWPGDGQSDSTFDQLFASQQQGMGDDGALEAMMRAAGGALLDRIGPAVLLTHSMGAPPGWTIADARPGLTRAILAIEPNGPPVREARFIAPPEYFDDEPDMIGRPWGITKGPLTFDPPVSDPGELRFVRQDKADGPELVRGWLQAEPARKLVNLAGIPILILTGEASYHAPYDHATSAFLHQAGVEHDFVRLADVGITGNGHMMMLEKNNLDIAEYLRTWLEANVE